MEGEVNVKEALPVVKRQASICFMKMPKVSMYGFNDLVQEGLLYSMRSWEKFDLDNGTPFLAFLNRGLFFCFSTILGKEMRRVVGRREADVSGFEQYNPRSTPFSKDIFADELTETARQIVEVLLSDQAVEAVENDGGEHRSKNAIYAALMGIPVRDYLRAVGEIKHKLQEEQTI